MLIAPMPTRSLDAVEAELNQLSGQADLYRIAALAARQGAHPTSTLITDAEAAQVTLDGLLEALDLAIDGLRPGAPEFAAWLRTRVTTMALLESIGNSLDVLEQLSAVTPNDPVHIGHSLGLKTAAE